jgi:hypothetical protein
MSPQLLFVTLCLISAPLIQVREKKNIKIYSNLNFKHADGIVFVVNTIWDLKNNLTLFHIGLNVTTVEAA